MGVPSLFRWIARKYPGCIYAVKDEEIDNLYLDLNGIIHPCCHPAHKPAPESEEEMFREIFRTIDHLVRMAKPKHLLYIAVDGVAPRAKMNQQRERRFKVGDADTADAINNEAAERSRFDSNCITPGTPFMQRLHMSLIRYVESRMAEKGSVWDTLAVIYSGCDVPGEGEHKIYEFVRSVKGNGIRHAICGLDADLIFLSLVTHEPSFRVLREDVFWIEEQQRSYCTRCNEEGHTMGNCVPREYPPYIYLDISVLRGHLEKNFADPIKMGANFEKMVDDWVFMCFFVGNDFLPCIPSMDIRVNAIETITNTYVTGLIKRHKYLTDNGKIYIPELIEMMKELGAKEKTLLRAKLNAYVNTTKRRGGTPRQEDMDMKLFEEAGKNEYYAKRLHAHTEAEVEKVCMEYVRGLAWVLSYYTKGCVSWSWYYPLHFAPLAADIAKTLQKQADISFRFTADIPKRPLEQIMAVLPPRSSESVPAGLHKIFEQSAENYPTKIEIDMFGKTQTWQGVALLPFLDYNKLVAEVRECVSALPLEEVYRNIEGSSVLIVSTANANYAQIESVYTNFVQTTGCMIKKQYYAGRINMHAHALMPGQKAKLEAEGKEYTVCSLSAVHMINK